MSADNHDTQTAIVVYDGQCPLCSREIAHYRRRRGAERVAWVDATTDEPTLARLGLDRATALARFHVRDGSGEWRIGAGAFVLLWSLLPAYRWLATSVRVLHLQPLLEWGYDRFLRWRGRRRCTPDRCDGGGAT